MMIKFRSIRCGQGVRSLNGTN